MTDIALLQQLDALDNQRKDEGITLQLRSGALATIELHNLTGKRARYRDGREITILGKIAGKDARHRYAFIIAFGDIENGNFFTASRGAFRILPRVA